MMLPYVILTFLVYPEKKTGSNLDNLMLFSNVGLPFTSAKYVSITFFQEVELQIIANQ